MTQEPIGFESSLVEIYWLLVEERNVGIYSIRGHSFTRFARPRHSRQLYTTSVHWENCLCCMSHVVSVWIQSSNIPDVPRARAPIALSGPRHWPRSPSSSSSSSRSLLCDQLSTPSEVRAVTRNAAVMLANLDQSDPARSRTIRVVHSYVGGHLGSLGHGWLISSQRTFPANTLRNNDGVITSFWRNYVKMTSF